MVNSRRRARQSESESDLPRELLSLIGKRLDTSIDVLRFRSVCKSWRASLPRSYTTSLLKPLRFPFPTDTDANRRTNAFFIRRIIYCFSPLGKWISSSKTKGWLAKVESKHLRKLRFVDHLSDSYVERIGDDNNDVRPPSEANWLDLRVYEVGRSYSLEYRLGDPVYGVTKVVMSPDSVWTDPRTCTIVAVYRGKLGFAKHGDEKWTLIDENNSEYDDVIAYKGQVCAVDRSGSVSWIDSSMKLIQSSRELPSGNQKHLVECGGELYAVERLVLDKFKVYRMIEKRGRWEEVRNLGDHSFVMGKDGCFSVFTPHFKVLSGNSIYFIQAGTFCGSHSVFDLKKRRSSSLDMEITQFVGPPPMWLD